MNREFLQFGLNTVRFILFVRLYGLSLSFSALVALLYSNQYCWDRLFPHHSNCAGHFYQQYNSHSIDHPPQYNFPRQGKT